MTLQALTCDYLKLSQQQATFPMVRRSNFSQIYTVLFIMYLLFFVNICFLRCKHVWYMCPNTYTTSRYSIITTNNYLHNILRICLKIDTLLSFLVIRLWSWHCYNRIRKEAEHKYKSNFRRLSNCGYRRNTYKVCVWPYTNTYQGL